MVEAEPGKIGAEAAARRANPKVRRQRQAKASANGSPLYGSHDGEGSRKEAQSGAVQRSDVLAGVGREVEACAEVLSFRGEDDGAAPERCIELLIGGGNGLNERRVEVVVGRSAQAHDGHVRPVPFDCDVTGAHVARSDAAMSSRLRQ
jgi:hypothetical protein